jgi:homoserine O-acetyltransferase
MRRILFVRAHEDALKSDPAWNGGFKAALGRIKAKTLVVPFSHDMFFPPEDREAEQKLIPNSKFRVVDSLWANFAMFCMTRSDREQIDGCIRDLLNETLG